MILLCLGIIIWKFFILMGYYLLFMLTWEIVLGCKMLKMVNCVQSFSKQVKCGANKTYMGIAVVIELYLLLLVI